MSSQRTSIRTAIAFALFAAVVANLTPAAVVGQEVRTREQIRADATAKIVAAGIANAVANQKNDGGLLEGVAIVAARKLRRKAIESALKDVYPDMSPRARFGTAVVIGLVLDDKLTIKNVGKKAVKAEIKAYLRTQNPRLGDTAEVVDFVYLVHQAMSDGRKR